MTDTNTTLFVYLRKNNRSDLKDHLLPLPLICNVAYCATTVDSLLCVMSSKAVSWCSTLTLKGTDREQGCGQILAKFKTERISSEGQGGALNPSINLRRLNLQPGQGLVKDQSGFRRSRLSSHTGVCPNVP